jgi:hypothetical protein
MSEAEWATFTMGVIFGVTLAAVVFVTMYIVTGSHSHPRQRKSKENSWPR